jgi:lysozyme
MTLLERIKRHEGLRLKPYRCSSGKLTIGYGRNLEDNGISAAEADSLLNEDIKRCEAECQKAFPWFTQLNSTRQGVIVELDFNLGLTRLLGFKKMLAACEQGNYEQAAREMLDSLWARQVGQRAVTLAELMKGTKNA